MTSPGRRDAKVFNYKADRNLAGTVRGRFSLQLPSGLVLHGLKLMRGEAGKPWIGMPAELQRTGEPKLGENGKPLWSCHIAFDSGASRKRFKALALDALREAHPEEFEPADEP